MANLLSNKTVSTEGLAKKFPRVKVKYEIANESLLQLLPRLYYSKLDWNFELGRKTLKISFDGEDIGEVSTTQVYGERGYKVQLVIEGKYLTTRKSHNQKKTADITSAESIILSSFRSSTPDEIIGPLYGIIQTILSAIRYKHSPVADDKIRNNTDIIIDYLVNLPNTLPPPMQELSDFVRSEQEKYNENKQLSTNIANAVLVWERGDRYEVFYQVGGTFQRKEVYAEYDLIPDKLKGKLSVMRMFEEDSSRYEPGVGYVINKHQWWVIL